MGPNHPAIRDFMGRDGTAVSRRERGHACERCATFVFRRLRISEWLEWCEGPTVCLLSSAGFGVDAWARP